EVSERLTKHLARRGAPEGFLQGTACKAESGGGHRRAEHVERGHGHLEALSRFAKPLRGRDAAIGKFKAGKRMRRYHFDALGNFKSACALVNKECGDSTRCGLLTGAREDYIEIRDASVRDPGFFSVQHVAFAIASCFAAQRCDVGASFGLGERERRDKDALADAREVAVFLRGSPEQSDGSRAQALHGKGEIRETRMTRQRFTNYADRARIDCVACSAVGCAADGVFQPAAFTELAHELAACVVHIRLVASADFLRSPSVEILRERAVALVEERPFHVALLGQTQSPLNTGFCLATNAS